MCEEETLKWRLLRRIFQFSSESIQRELVFNKTQDIFFNLLTEIY